MALFLIISVLLAACAGNPATETQPPTSPPRATLAETPGAPAEPPTRTPEPGFTLLAPTGLPGLAPTIEPCVNDARFVTDVTIPDLSQFLPGAPLDKQWQIQNTGTCAWGPDYRVVFADGAAMTAAVEHALYPARPGADAIVRIQMTAPDAPGEYQGDWQLRDPENNAFGPVLFIKIKVIPLPAGE